MATFDQLPAEQRAILELVVGRGQSYDELSEMLGMPSSRVRELAREALGDLAPATAARVDSDWRGQIADYLLGQQTGPESTATKGHLKRSEPGRAWAYSLLDSLSHLYSNGTTPEIPDAGAAPVGGAPPPRDREPVAAPAPVPAAAAEPAAAPAPAGRAPTRSATAGGGLSPAARTVVRRRRIAAGAVGAALVALVAVLLIAGVFSSGGGSSSSSGGSSAPASAPSRATAYEVWLYNSSGDSLPLGAQFTDAQGNLQGRGVLPGNWHRFKSVVLSRERVGTNPKSPANIVLRANLTALPAGAVKPGTSGGVKIVSQGVLKAPSGEPGAGLAIVLVQGGQHQLVVQAARLTPTTNVLAPATGATGATGP